MNLHESLLNSSARSSLHDQVIRANDRDQQILLTENSVHIPRQRKRREKNPYSGNFSAFLLILTSRGMNPSISTQFSHIFFALLVMMRIFFFTITVTKHTWMLKFDRIALLIMIALFLSAFFGIPPLRQQLFKEFQRKFRRCRAYVRIIANRLILFYWNLFNLT